MTFLQKLLCCVLLMHVSKCYLFNEETKIIPFVEYYVTSTKIINLQGISDDREKVTNKFLIFQIQFEKDQIYDIVIRLKNAETVNWKTNFYIYQEYTEYNMDVKDENFNLVEGFVLSKQNSSSVIGFIDNIYFYGIVLVDDVVYYIEHIKKYPEIFEIYKNSESNAIIYKEDYLKLPEDYYPLDLFENHVQFIRANSEKELYKSIIGNGKVCTLFVLVDNSFLRIIHGNNVRAAIRNVLNSIEEVNSLFRSTDFDGDGSPDNVGFLIKYFVVLQSEKTPMNLVPTYKNVPINGRIYLDMFSNYQLLTDVCLGVAFTAQVFKNNVIGISYTAEPTNSDVFSYSVGGICDRPFKFQSGRNLNTLAITAKLKNGNTIPQAIFDLSLAHELGHSFGSDHDVSKSCRGHLMSKQTPKDNQRKHFIFSSCSKKQMLKVIMSKGHCFEKYEQPFCGNGKIDPGEDCDCGTIRDCQTYDICCTPRGQQGSCKVNKKLGYKCHPAQGICCSSKCTYKDLSNFDVDCKNFQSRCPCKSKSHTCSCGVNGMCTGNICSSKECTRIFLSECSCPITGSKSQCRTCCLYNNACLPSNILTAKLIQEDEIFIKRLKDEKESKHTTYGYYQNFCNNISCVKLHFREVEIGNYCVTHGKLGVCMGNYKCVVPLARQIYPNVEIRSKACVKSVIRNLLLANMFNLLLMTCK